MTGWKTDPEVNIGWRTPVVFQNRAYGEQAFEIKKMAPGQDKRGQRGSVADRPPARTGRIAVVFAKFDGIGRLIFADPRDRHAARTTCLYLSL